jgi:hypothetical protein
MSVCAYAAVCERGSFASCSMWRRHARACTEGALVCAGDGCTSEARNAAAAAAKLLYGQQLAAPATLALTAIAAEALHGSCTRPPPHVRPPQHRHVCCVCVCVTSARTRPLLGDKALPQCRQDVIVVRVHLHRGHIDVAAMEVEVWANDTARQLERRDASQYRALSVLIETCKHRRRQGLPACKRESHRKRERQRERRLCVLSSSECARTVCCGWVGGCPQWPCGANTVSAQTMRRPRRRVRPRRACRRSMLKTPC